MHRFFSVYTLCLTTVLFWCCSNCVASDSSGVGRISSAYTVISLEIPERTVVEFPRKYQESIKNTLGRKESVASVVVQSNDDYNFAGHRVTVMKTIEARGLTSFRQDEFLAGRPADTTPTISYKKEVGWAPKSGSTESDRIRVAALSPQTSHSLFNSASISSSPFAHLRSHITSNTISVIVAPE